MNKKSLFFFILAMCCTKLESAAHAHTYAQSPENTYREQNFSLWDFSAMVSAQAGVDCGLHALKNSIALYNYYSGIIDEISFEQQLRANTVGTLGIAACRAEVGTIGLLAPEELYRLAERLPAPYNIALHRHELLILDNLSNPLHIRTEEQNYQLANLIDRLQNKEPFVQALVIGSMNEGREDGGHWVGAALLQSGSGERFLYIANSLGYTNRLLDRDAKHANEEFDRKIAFQFNHFLAELSRNPGSTGLRLQGIRSLLGNILIGMQNRHYEPALIDIHNAINKAVLHRLMGNPAFQTIRDQLLSRLSVIPTKQIGHQYAELQRYLIDFLTSPMSWNPPQTNHPAQEPPFASSELVQAQLPAQPHRNPDAERLAHEEQASLALAIRLEQEDIQQQLSTEGQPVVSTREIRALLGNIRNNIRNLRYRSALINIHNAVNKAVLKGLLNNPTFTPTKQQLIEILQEIPLLQIQGLGRQYLELQLYLLDFLTSSQFMSWNPPQTGNPEQERTA